MSANEVFDSRQIMNDLLYFKHRDHEKVISLSQKLYEYAIQENDEYAKAYALLYFSFGYIGIYKLIPSIEYGQMAYALQKKNQYVDLLQLQLNVLGNAFMYKGDSQSAMKYFTEALQFAKLQNDNHLLGAIYYNLADLYQSVGSYDQALDYCRRSYEMLEVLSDNPLNISINRPDYYLVLSKISFCLKDYKKASEYLEKCRLLSESDVVPNDFNIRIMEAKLINADPGSFHSQDVIHKVVSTFDLLKTTSSKEYINIFNTYYDGILLLFECGAFLLCQQYSIYILEIAEYLELSEFWLRYYDLIIQISEALLNSSVSDNMNYDSDSEHLFHCYEQYYHYSLLRDKEVKHEQLLRLKDMLALHETQKQNTLYRHAVSTLKLQTEQDELSNCANRKGLTAFLNDYFEYMKQSGIRFSCILLDIDYFKQYNDNYGHLYGDECIRKVGLILKDSSPDDGFIARYGGDEFILIYMDKSDDELIEIAKKIQNNITALHIPHAFSPVDDHVTLTQGLVNQIPKAKDTPEDLLHIADEALYQVKRTGRNNYLLIKK